MELKQQKVRIARIVIIAFFSVGIIGFLMPLSYPFFKQLIPLALILSFLLLVIFHPKERRNLHSIFVFTGIYFTGLILEVIGVNTGVVFGEYSYGPNLGIKIFNTPVIIGLNWLILVYTTSSIFEKLNIHVVTKVLLASSCMVVFDLILEQIAPGIGMWNFNGSEVPLKNYLSWFIISVIFQTALKMGGIKTENSLAKTIFISQFIFFLILSIFLP